MSKFIELKGKKIGNWQVIERAPDRYGCCTFWLCKCDCGNKQEVRASALNTGRSSKCIICRNKQNTKVKHGKSNTRIYWVWASIVKRCVNPTKRDKRWYEDVSVYDKWKNSFEAFYDYIQKNLGEKPEGYSIDRIDNGGSYEPGNIRWASPSEQMLNRNSWKWSEESKKRYSDNWYKRANISKLNVE